MGFRTSMHTLVYLSRFLRLTWLCYWFFNSISFSVSRNKKNTKYDYETGREGFWLVQAIYKGNACREAGIKYTYYCRLLSLPMWTEKEMRLGYLFEKMGLDGPREVISIWKEKWQHAMEFKSQKRWRVFFILPFRKRGSWLWYDWWRRLTMAKSREGRTRDGNR